MRIGQDHDYNFIPLNPNANWAILLECISSAYAAEAELRHSRFFLLFFWLQDYLQASQKELGFTVNTLMRQATYAVK